MTIKALARRLAPQTAVEWHRRSRLVARARDLALRMAETADPEQWWALLEEFSEFRPIQRGNEFVRLMELVRLLEPVRICEIGSASGGTLCALARAARQDATLVTLDLEFSPERKAAFPDFRRGEQQIICIEGDSHDRGTRDLVREAFGDAPLDVLLIDGDHTYEGVRRDFEMYRSLVRPGGLIVFHDIVKDFGQRFGTPTRASTGGVPDFWSELKARHSDAQELVEDPAQDGYGIGLIRGTTRRLNIGCGKKRLVDAINLDISPHVGADVVHDLNQTPWPFDTGTFDEVHAYDVLEHVSDVVRTLEEIHRICRPDATVHVTVPHFSSSNAFTDVTHRHWFGWHSIDPFDGANDLSHYSGARFRRRHTRISFYKSFGNVLVPRLANRWPDTYERRWAWIFPAWFLYFQLEVLK